MTKPRLIMPKLNLVYCHIAAPVSGRVGLRLVDPGNIVHASDTNAMFVITQLQPIAVLFTLPEDNLQQYRGEWRRARSKWTRSAATIKPNLRLANC